MGYNNYNEYKSVDFSDLVGKTLVSIGGLEKDSEEVVLTCSDGRVYKMYHWESCCEHVSVEDICGDIEDILNSEILVAEEVYNSEDPPKCEFEESYTWTYYKIDTVKGGVTIRWYGSSNGYYSEEVSFIEYVGGAN